MAASGDLRQILSPARFNTLPTDTQSVLLQAWNTHTGLLKSELEKTKVDSEQKIIGLQKKNQDLETRLAVFTEESEKGQSVLAQYREQATASGANAARLTEENAKLAAEKDEFQRRFHNAQAERDDVTGLSERRQEEIERLHAKIQELTGEVNRAVAAKCEAQCRLDDLDTKEMNIAFKEKRLEEEKSFLESQIEMLKEEVEKRSDEVLSAKREAGVRQVELNQEISEKTEQLKSVAKREEDALESAENYKRYAEKLNERLREARESETKLEENYRAELKSANKLADLYKQQGEENTLKTEELSKAVSTLQQLLREAGEKYGKLEIEIDTLKASHQEQIQAKKESIKALQKELEDANKLIKTVKDKGLTEDAIEHLSPSAAQASRLLKSGVTLTGIYSQMMTLSDELAEEKEENKRLNSYMDQILKEIEERAPILKQQREDYEQAISALGGLTENLEAAREEVDLRRREAEEARQRTNSLGNDRDRLEQQVSDLGRQIAVLVREVEAARNGGQSFEPPQTVDISSPKAVIEARLLTFKDVTELQQRNIELLAVVRQLSDNRDQAESTMIQEKTAEVRQELDTALRQAEELRAARERQQLMVENLIQQRDMYKSMCKDPAQITAARKVEATEGDSQRIEELESQLEEVKKEFAEYKKDKAENYNMLDNDYKKLRDELFEARSQAAKLTSHEEYNTEKFKIAQANAASYKKTIEALEVRNKQLDVIAAKHETSIASLKDELIKQGRKLSQAEFQADKLTQENIHLKSVEARLSSEREVLYQEKKSSNAILANLQQIQANLELKDDQHRIKLQEANSQLSKEVDLLRKKLNEDQDHFKESVRSWEFTNRELREKAERSELSAADALKQLAAMTTTLETMKEELKEKADELQLAESRLAGRGQYSTQSSTSEGEGKNRYRDVEILLGKSKQEIKQLNNQLAAEKKKVEEFKQMSEAAEIRMLESSKAMTDYKNEADSRVKQLEVEKNSAERLMKDSQVQVNDMKKKIEDLEAEVGTSGGELRDKLKRTMNELQEARERMKVLEDQDAEIRTKVSALAVESKEAQEKYERELLLHAKDIEILNNLKAETSSKRSNLDQVEFERTKAEEKLTEMKETFEAESDRLKEEVTALRELIDVLKKENGELMNQVESVSGQLSDLSATGQTLDTSNLDVSNVSIRSTGDGEESTEKLMAVVKFLRREKEILYGRLEVAQAELARTTRQLEHAQKQFSDSQAALELERQSANENLMTAGKHAELLRKVESLAAITDSNKYLREEKENLSNIVQSAKQEAEEAKQKIAPLEAKIKDLEESYGELLVEKNAIQSESEGWKKRSDQLVEKSFKMNPEELKRLQDAEVKLSKSVSTLTSEKENLSKKLNKSVKDFNSTKSLLSAAQQDLKNTKDELEKKLKELKTMETSQKNVTANLSKQINETKKKLEDAEKSKEELKQQLSAAQSKANEAKVGGEEIAALKDEIASLEAAKAKQAEEITKIRGIVKNLKSIGRNFREKSENLTSENTSLKKENEDLKGSTEKLTAELLNAKSLIDDLSPEKTQKLIDTNEALVKKTEELEKVASEKEQRAKKVLETARVKIADLTARNQELNELVQEKDKTLLEDLKKEKDQMKNAMESVINKLKNENLSLKNSLNEIKEEKDRLNEQIETLNQELLATSKPVALAGVHQQDQRKQVQPQAHIQPHRHTPRDDHRPTQTASIRPMTQRAAAAVVLPSQVVSSAQPEIATVQPTVSVSPSVSSAANTPQVPSTSLLDPNTPEFIPASVQTTNEVVDTGDESSRQTVRQESVQASTSIPQSLNSAQTASSSVTQTTASVHPTMKRARETEFVVDDQEAGPSGLQKKARTVSLTPEEFAGTNLDEDIDDLTESQDVENENEVEIEETGEDHDVTGLEVEASGSLSGQMEVSTPTDAKGAETISAEADVEEGEISDDEEVGEAIAPDIDVLAEDEAEIDDGEGDEDTDHIAPDNQELLAEQHLGDDDAENSSEPSSSTGAAVPPQHRSQQLEGSRQAAGFEQDPVEDSVVPSTPKLVEQRRSDGFSEAVSSPQVPSNERFVFGGGAGSSSATELVVTSTGLVGQERVERTSFDIIAQFASEKEKEGRTVPGTPQPASPAPQSEEAVDVGEASAEPAQTADTDTEQTAAHDPEEGVSSSGVEPPSRPGRKPITWSGSPTGPASTSPQRTLNRTAAGLERQFKTAVRGIAKPRGGKRGGNKP